jgi:hypothetical protein
MPRCARGFIFGLWAGTVVAGCAITPQPMFGSEMNAGTFATGPAWGTSFGPSEARVVANDGTVHVIDGNGDSVLGYSPAHPGLVVPVAVVARGAVLPRLDVGAHAGWYGAGLGARARLNDPMSARSWYLSVDAQGGYAIPYDDRTHDLGTPYAGRLLIETAGSSARLWQLLGAIGLSAGLRRHGVDVSSFLPSDSIDRIFGAENTLAVERAELRLEGGIGFSCLLGWRIGLQAMVMPYVVLAHGSPRFECLNCSAPVTLESFNQQWGVSILLSPFVVLGRR